MPQVVVIVGSGIVGRSWAIIFAKGGYAVRLYDTVANQLSLAEADIGTKLSELQSQGLWRDECGSVADAKSRVRTFTDLALAFTENPGETIVHAQECVPETIDAKKAVFAQLDAAAPKHTVLASSTSNIPASHFTEALPGRHRCLVAHPVNPPYLIPLVEIVPAPWTSPELVPATRALMKAVGQAPIVLKKEVNGFALNRLQYALLAEAMRMVEDGVADPEDIDTCVTHGLSTRWSFMGPFQTIDLNAPGGVGDYCHRYLGGMYGVLAGQDNTRQVSAATVTALEETMRAKYPTQLIPTKSAWRDERLMKLAQHKQECQLIDDRYSALLATSPQAQETKPL